MIRKALFLIGNRHFLIRKCHFGIRRGSYVDRVELPHDPSTSYQELEMIRRRLLIAIATIASVALAACSDMTAPKNETCPVVGGSSTCTH